MKSSWTFSATGRVGRAISLILAVLVLPTAVGAKRKKKPEDLTNVLLSPAYSQWLVGAVSRIASEEELGAFLQLTSDQDAIRFIDEFWERHGGDRSWPEKSNRQILEEREEEADKLFSEAAYAGRRTDRGTIFVLYGAPDEITYQISPRPQERRVEIWLYDKDAEPGLDGQRPKAAYYFTRVKDLTEFYRGPPIRRPIRGG